MDGWFTINPKQRNSRGVEREEKQNLKYQNKKQGGGSERLNLIRLEADITTPSPLPPKNAHIHMNICIHRAAHFTYHLSGAGTRVWPDRD